MIGYVAVDLYWERIGKVVRFRFQENDTVYLYWGRNGRVWRCISLLKTVW